jgi:hypothetical protein
VEQAPKIRILSGEQHREFVLTQEEANYLAAAPEPLASVATVLLDTGMRRRCSRLQWASVITSKAVNGYQCKTDWIRTKAPSDPVCSLVEDQEQLGRKEPS